MASSFESIDELYAELYPNSPNADRNKVTVSNSRNLSSAAHEETKGRRDLSTSPFDDDDDDEGKESSSLRSAPSNTGKMNRVGVCPSVKVCDFDSDDDDDGCSAAAPHQRKGCDVAVASSAASSGISSSSAMAKYNMVPFPNVSQRVYERLAAYHKCTQTSKGYVCGPSSKNPSRDRVATMMTMKDNGENNDDGNCGVVANEAERLRELFESNNSLSALTALATNPKRHHELLKRKGAFHVVTPELGNGCQDYKNEPICEGSEDTNDAKKIAASLSGDGTSLSCDDVALSAIDPRDNARAGACGGCPFLICRKCDHPVVRHDGVRWYSSKLKRCCSNTSSMSKGKPIDYYPFQLDEDVEPETNLYLVVRNYYPDWSRIATASIVAGAHASTSANQTATMSPQSQPSNNHLSPSGLSPASAPNGPTAAAGNKAKGIEAFDDSSSASSDDDGDAVTNLKKLVPIIDKGTASSTTTTAAASAAEKSTFARSGGCVDGELATPGTVKHALVSDPNASAYCCQCSWLTVYGTRVGSCITTTVADVATHAHVVNPPGVQTRFISVVACGKPLDYDVYARGATSDRYKRRLPLWVCKGHIQ